VLVTLALELPQQLRPGRPSPERRGVRMPRVQRRARQPGLVWPAESHHLPDCSPVQRKAVEHIPAWWLLAWLVVQREPERSERRRLTQARQLEPQAHLLVLWLAGPGGRCAEREKLI
jgi:hypothetical protein